MQRQYFTYQGTDKVLKRLHENLNRIEWICENKKPYPMKEDPANKPQVDSDFLNSSFKKAGHGLF